MKPLIGIAGYNMFRVDHNHLSFDMDIVPKAISDLLKDANAVPMILPLSSPDIAKDYIDKIDALILAGGSDVDPLLYDEEPKEKIGPTNPKRDAFEIALIREAWRQKKPILGICRGLQLLNVYFGGSLFQDLSYNPNVTVQHVQETPWKFPTHSITLEPGSFLGNILGPTQKINSYHHQAIKDLADVFKPIAWSADGIIEGIESVDASQKVIGIQWHPELLVEMITEHGLIFEEFVNLIE